MGRRVRGDGGRGHCVQPQRCRRTRCNDLDIDVERIPHENSWSYDRIIEGIEEHEIASALAAEIAAEMEAEAEAASGE